MNQVYIGLPVKDLSAAVIFYKGLGFEQDMRFVGAHMAQFKVSETIYITLFPKEDLLNNIPLKNLNDDHYGGVTIALSCEDRQKVEELVGLALEQGGQQFTQDNDNDFMYMNGFCDLDGHVWTAFSMKM